jgi:guanylate kinase
VEALKARLAGRKTESEEALALRMQNARSELAEAERYQHVVVNDELESAVARVGAIIDDEHGRPERRPALGATVSAVVKELLAELQQTS